MGATVPITSSVYGYIKVLADHLNIKKTSVAATGCKLMLSCCYFFFLSQWLNMKNEREELFNVH